jgi:hypothetical protein
MSDRDAAPCRHLPEPPAGPPIRAPLALAAGERSLDSGYGPGRLTTANAAGTGTLVVGLDRAAAMLAVPSSLGRVSGRPTGPQVAAAADFGRDAVQAPIVDPRFTVDHVLLPISTPKARR